MSMERGFYMVCVYRWLRYSINNKLYLTDSKIFSETT